MYRPGESVCEEEEESIFLPEPDRRVSNVGSISGGSALHDNPSGMIISSGAFEGEQEVIPPVPVPDSDILGQIERDRDRVSYRNKLKDGKAKAKAVHSDRLLRVSPKLAVRMKVASTRLRSYDLPDVRGLIAHEKGSRRPEFGSGVEADEFNKESIVKEAFAVMTTSMAKRVVVFHADELDAMGSEKYADAVCTHLRTHVEKGSGAMMRRAVLALQSIQLFVHQHYKILPEDFDYSSGMISIYLSAQTAVTMPKSRLEGLRYAHNVLGAACHSIDKSLDPYKKKVSLGGHAPATPLGFALHISYIASHATSAYVSTYAGSFNAMILASLRFCDAMASGVPALQDDAIDGKARKSKMNKLPMFWYCPRRDLSGSERWYVQWIAQLAELQRDHLFPDFEGDSILEARAWSASRGPPPKRKVVAAYIAILGLPPLSLPPSEARRFLRLHGMRRVISIIGRLLSGKLKLTVEDRNELGRWLIALGAQGTSAASLPNMYSDEASRPRQIAVREKVLGPVRDCLKAYFSTYAQMPLENSFLLLLSLMNLPAPAFADCEPPLDASELEDEAISDEESRASSDDEEPAAGTSTEVEAVRRKTDLPPGYAVKTLTSATGASTYKVYYAPDGKRVGQSMRAAWKHFEA